VLTPHSTLSEVRAAVAKREEETCPQRVFPRLEKKVELKPIIYFLLPTLALNIDFVGNKKENAGQSGVEQGCRGINSIYRA
jgi:hypothetical protein